MSFKEAGTAWKEISAAMERPLYDIKRRYGELRRTRAETEKKPAKGKGKRDEESTKQEKGDEGPASARMTIPFLQADERWSKPEVRTSRLEV
jgi:hypothetical protein